MVRYLDPVHGELQFEDLMEELILTDEFQRTDQVKQLGLTDKVYPGAKHTRFLHMLGASYIAGRIAQQLKVPPEHERLIRIALLLHDIGHYDFSHALEHLTEQDHEENGKRIIAGDVELPHRRKGQIAEALRRHGIDPATLIAFLDRKGGFPQFYYDILSNPIIDADRMDYLLRDNHFAGTDLGAIELDRLISTLIVDEEGKLGIHQYGLASLEQFLVARNHMYRQVYMHAQTAAGEAMLRKAAMASMEVASPFMYGDDRLLGRLLEQGTPLSRRLVALLCNGHRSFYIPALRIDANSAEELKACVDRIDCDQMEQELLRRTGLQEGDILVSAPGQHKRTKALPAFKVKLTNDTWVELFDISPIARAAAEQPVSNTKFVVYCAREHKEQVHQAALAVLRA